LNIARVHVTTGIIGIYKSTDIKKQGGINGREKRDINAEPATFT
jgi:hypothetical protein